MGLYLLYARKTLRLLSIPSAVSAGYIFMLCWFIPVCMFILTQAIWMCRSKYSSLHPLVGTVLDGIWMRLTEEVFSALLECCKGGGIIISV